MSRVSVIASVFAGAVIAASCAEQKPSDAAAQAPVAGAAAAASGEPAAELTITDSVFGAVVARAQENCLRTAAHLTPGRKIHIVLFDRSTIVPATVGNPAPGCGDGANTQQRAYQLESFDLVAGDFGIAVLVQDLKTMMSDRTDIDRDGKHESYRVCTSTEGVHLTVWSGEVVENKRLWHDYYYLGYDLIPTCTERETAGK